MLQHCGGRVGWRVLFSGGPAESAPVVQESDPEKVHLYWLFLIPFLIFPPHFLTSDEWEHFLNKLPATKCFIQALLSDESKLRHQLVKGT